MPNPWYPGAVRDPGVAAGYRRGRNRMNSVKCHYTVGHDSWNLIKRDGLAQFLVRRNGEVGQFAEVDCLCWDSGEWNDDGPGIEIEFYDEPEGIFTDASRAATSELIYWLNREWGIPLEYYDGDRLPEGSWNGFIAHRSLQQRQPHNDYWPRVDWDRMVSGEAQQEGDDVKGLWIKRENEEFVWLLFGGYRIACGGKGQVDVMAYMGMTSNGWDNVVSMSAHDFDEIPILEWTQTLIGRYVTAGIPE